MKAVGYRTPSPITAAEALVDIEMPMPEARGRDLLVEIRAVSVISKKFPTSSIADALTTYAETKPFTHDENVRQVMAEKLAQQKALAIGRGEDGKKTEADGLKVFKGLDLLGLLKPDARTHEIDTGKLDKTFDAYMRVQSLEGRNLDASTFKNTVVQSGTLAQTLSTEGMTRMLLYASDVGSRAGSQAKMMNRLLSGGLGGSLGKAQIAKMTAEGFMVEDKSDPKFMHEVTTGSGKKQQTHMEGRFHAVDEERSRLDPIGFITDTARANMTKKGMDPSEAVVSPSSRMASLTSTHGRGATRPRVMATTTPCSARRTARGRARSSPRTKPGRLPSSAPRIRPGSRPRRTAVRRRNGRWPSCGCASPPSRPPPWTGSASRREPRRCR